MNEHRRNLDTYNDRDESDDLTDEEYAKVRKEAEVEWQNQHDQFDDPPETWVLPI